MDKLQETIDNARATIEILWQCNIFYFICAWSVLAVNVYDFHAPSLFFCFVLHLCNLGLDIIKNYYVIKYTNKIS